jgi:hypothetical protein
MDRVFRGYGPICPPCVLPQRLVHRHVRARHLFAEPLYRLPFTSGENMCNDLCHCTAADRAVATFCFCLFQMDPETDGPLLPTKNSETEEFRPFSRRVPEFKFWYVL